MGTGRLRELQLRHWWWHSGLGGGLGGHGGGLSVSLEEVLATMQLLRRWKQFSLVVQVEICLPVMFLSYCVNKQAQNEMFRVFSLTACEQQSLVWPNQNCQVSIERDPVLPP